VYGTLAGVLANVRVRVGMLEGLGYVFTLPRSGKTIRFCLLKLIQVLLYRISFRFLSLLIFLNSDDPVDLVERYSLKVKRFEILGGIGVNLSVFNYSPARINPVTFLFIGRMLDEKGINDFVEAAKQVKGKFPDARFIALGGVDYSNPGSIRPEVVKRYQMEGLIDFPGHVTDIIPWLNASSVFVLPSYYREGVPRSTQEALAVGRAVITTDVPGCRDTVIDGVNGFLISPQSPVELAQRMLYFLENPQVITIMGNRSREIACDKFNAIVVNDRLLKMLDSL
jgi:glycosyltransferase involved in cell wall biosynthesis